MGSNLLIQGLVYCGYNPLILTFDPNFLVHPNELRCAKENSRVVLIDFTTDFCRECPDSCYTESLILYTPKKYSTVSGWWPDCWFLGPPKQWGLKKFPPKTKVGNFHNKACNLSLDVVLFLFHQDKLETKCVAYKKQKKKRPKTWHPLYKTPTKLTACTKNTPNPATFARLGFGWCLRRIFSAKKHQLHQNRGAQNRASQLQSSESSTFQNLSGRIWVSQTPRRPHHSVPMYSHGIQRFFRVRSTSGKELGQQNVLVGFLRRPNGGTDVEMNLSSSVGDDLGFCGSVPR